MEKKTLFVCDGIFCGKSAQAFQIANHMFYDFINTQTTLKLRSWERKHSFQLPAASNRNHPTNMTHPNSLFSHYSRTSERAREKGRELFFIPSAQMKNTHRQPAIHSESFVLPWENLKYFWRQSTQKQIRRNVRLAWRSWCCCCCMVPVLYRRGRGKKRRKSIKRTFWRAFSFPNDMKMRVDLWGLSMLNFSFGKFEWFEILIFLFSFCMTYFG